MTLLVGESSVPALRKALFDIDTLLSARARAETTHVAAAAAASSSSSSSSPLHATVSGRRRDGESMTAFLKRGALARAAAREAETAHHRRGDSPQLRHHPAEPSPSSPKAKHVGNAERNRNVTDEATTDDVTDDVTDDGTSWTTSVEAQPLHRKPSSPRRPRGGGAALSSSGSGARAPVPPPHTFQHPLEQPQRRTASKMPPSVSVDVESSLSVSENGPPVSEDVVSPSSETPPLLQEETPLASLSLHRSAPQAPAAENAGSYVESRISEVGSEPSAVESGILDVAPEPVVSEPVKKRARTFKLRTRTKPSSSSSGTQGVASSSSIIGGTLINTSAPQETSHGILRLHHSAPPAPAAGNPASSVESRDVGVASEPVNMSGIVDRASEASSSGMQELASSSIIEEGAYHLRAELTTAPEKLPPEMIGKSSIKEDTRKARSFKLRIRKPVGTKRVI